MILVMRSILIGLATSLVTCLLVMIGKIVWLSHSLPPDVSSSNAGVGYDLVGIFHSLQHKPLFLAGMAASFILAFLWSYRGLSRH
jgi:hypothetical protein